MVASGGTLLRIVIRNAGALRRDLLAAAEAGGAAGMNGAPGAMPSSA